MNEIEYLVVRSRVPVLVLLWHVLQLGNVVQESLTELVRYQRVALVDFVEAGDLERVMRTSAC
jgi:hypothetical protein